MRQMKRLRKNEVESEKCSKLLSGQAYSVSCRSVEKSWRREQANLKTGVHSVDRGFESRPLRHISLEDWSKEVKWKTASLAGKGK